jgi:threonine aldolase
MKTIDLRSDTITLPTRAMMEATSSAEMGDDVYSEDPATNRLEEMVIQLLGKEAALFTPSGTMSNLIAVMAQTRHGDEVILGDQAHILWYEVGGASALGGVVLRTVPNKTDGTLDLSELEKTIREDSIHFPPTTLLCLENTHNRCVGAVLTVEYTTAAAELAHRYGLKVHLDGARIFNAAVVLGIPAASLVEPVDSVCFCLSKGLSAPVGSLLCGGKEFISRARKLRRMLGGGMRQSGMLTAAGIVSLEQGIERLSEDHANARRLAQGLAEIEGIEINIARVESNIVAFEPQNVEAAHFISEMDKKGVRFTYFGHNRVRAVANRMVCETDIDEALSRVKNLLAKL